MIQQIYIPTYKRESSQLTFDGLPSKWKDKTVLVVHPEEVHKNYPTLSCPIQGTGIAPVRKWIAEHGQGKRYAVIDDDISFIYTRRENEEIPFFSKKFIAASVCMSSPKFSVFAHITA